MSQICRSCGAAIRWVTTTNGKKMPVDESPTEAGNILLTPDGAVVVPRDGPHDNRPRYISHFATCPSAHKHRSKK